MIFKGDPYPLTQKEVERVFLWFTNKPGILLNFHYSTKWKYHVQKRSPGSLIESIWNGSFV